MSEHDDGSYYDLESWISQRNRINNACASLTPEEEYHNQQLKGNEHWNSLIERILSASVSKKWDLAKKEWIRENYVEMRSTCFCGHSISMFTVFINKVNNNRIHLGTKCSKVFNVTWDLLI